VSERLALMMKVFMVAEPTHHACRVGPGISGARNARPPSAENGLDVWRSIARPCFRAANLPSPAMPPARSSSPLRADANLQGRSSSEKRRWSQHALDPRTRLVLERS
jgi:hypothetical protein